MPHRCCVPCCRGNYFNGPKVRIFGFPTDQVLRGKWLHAIKRKNFTPSKNSKVCELHFQRYEIQREVHIFNERNNKEAFLSYPRLIPGAVPSQIFNSPKYLTKPEVKQGREDPMVRRHRLDFESVNQAVFESLERLVDYNRDCSFNNFDEFKSKVVNFVVGNEWLLSKKVNCADFILLHEMPHPVIMCSARITQNLSVIVYNGSEEVKMLFGKKVPSHISNLNEVNDIIHCCFRKFSPVEECISNFKSS